jgi:hypothetical protein
LNQLQFAVTATKLSCDGEHRGAPMAIEKPTAIDCIRKARAVLLLDHPFFGALIFRLTPVSASSIPTMATDGKSLFYNPAFVDELPPDQSPGAQRWHGAAEGCPE